MKYTLLNYCEIDKFAIQSYNAVHNTDESFNLSDVSKVKFAEVGNPDIVVGGSPCQDFSVAGEKKGSAYTCRSCGHLYNPIEQHFSKRDKCPKCSSTDLEKTRSSLLVEYLRAVRESKPKFFIYENVKNIIGVKNKQTFDLFVKELNEYGYNIYYKVLSSKDYGIPQSRERVFVVGARKDIDGEFEFPEKFDNGVRLKDLLEDEVDEKYYIKSERAEKIIEQFEKGRKEQFGVDLTVNDPQEIERANCILSRYDSGISNLKSMGTGVVVPQPVPNKIQQIGNLRETQSFGGNPQTSRVYSEEGLSPTLTTAGSANLNVLINETTALRKGRNEYGKAIRKDYEKGLIKESRQNMTEYEVRPDGYCNTLTTVYNDNLVVTPSYRIRKLTPLECWRLMGFTDEQFFRAQATGMSNTQLYKQAGNSIVVDTLANIYKEMQKAYPLDFKDGIKVLSLFSGIGAFESAFEKLV